jgi:hypothetical protein
LSLILSELITTWTVRTWSSAELMAGSYIVIILITKCSLNKYLFRDDPHTFNPSCFLEDWPRNFFCCSVLVRDGFFFKNLLFFHYENMQEPVCIGRKWILIHSDQSILFYLLFLLLISADHRLSSICLSFLHLRTLPFWKNTRIWRKLIPFVRMMVLASNSVLVYDLFLYIGNSEMAVFLFLSFRFPVFLYSQKFVGVICSLYSLCSAM